MTILQLQLVLSMFQKVEIYTFNGKPLYKGLMSDVTEGLESTVKDIRIKHNKIIVRLDQWK